LSQGGKSLADRVVHRQPVGEARYPQRLGVAVAGGGQQELAAPVRHAPPARRNGPPSAACRRQCATITASAVVSMKSTLDMSRITWSLSAAASDRQSSNRWLEVTPSSPGALATTLPPCGSIEKRSSATLRSHRLGSDGRV